MNKEEIRDEEAREQHRSDWIKAEYETMGWSKDTICQCWKDDTCMKFLEEVSETPESTREGIKG